MSDNRTLLDIAIINFNVAYELQQKKTDDPIRLNIIGYHLQQATELALKHLLEMEGKNYPRTHDIGDLIDLLDCRENLSSLDLLSSKITELESKTRYDKDFSASIRTIEKIFPIIGNFIENIIENEKINGAEKAPYELFCESHSGNHIQNEALRQDWQKCLPKIAKSAMKFTDEKVREEVFLEKMKRWLREKYSYDEVAEAFHEAGYGKDDDTPPLPPR